MRAWLIAIIILVCVLWGIESRQYDKMMDDDFTKETGKWKN